MGKRGSVEKPSSTNITASEKLSSEIGHEAVDESEEPYTLTNNFGQDFRELAKRAGFPELQVVPRPRRPLSFSSGGHESAQSNTGKNDRRDEKRDDPKQDGNVLPSDSRRGTRPPSTFLVKDKYQYFKPCVQVEWDEEGNNKTMIKELHIRGWRIDDRIMDILNLTLPQQDKLVKIDFWNTGLTDKLLENLANIMKQLPLLKTLALDGNPVMLQRYGMFLGEESTIQTLSLRNCHVNDMGADFIGRALSTNRNLLTLNLCYNKISCEGAAFIAKGLRINRTLLCLDLGSNLIKDAGVSMLGEAISKFALNHEETVARRLLLSKKNVEEPAGQLKTINPSTARSERPPSVRSGSHLNKEDRQRLKEKQKGAKKEGKKVEEKIAKKVASSTDAFKEAKKGKKTSMAKVDKKGFTGVADQETTDVVEFPNPLLEPVEEIGGELYVPGNRALINLNLSRNKIGETGIKNLLNAVQYQSQLAVAHARTVGIGLMRLSLQRNLVAEENPVYQNLLELMVTRDPFFKPVDNFSHEDMITPIKEVE